MATNNKGDFLLGLLVGASVGAAVALLYAPSSGEETRGQIRSAADDVKGRAGDLTGTLKEKMPDVSGVTSKAQDLAAQVRERAASVASSVGSTVQDITQKGRDAASDVAAQASDVAASATEAVSGAVDQAAGAGGLLPDTDSGHKTGHRDLHELETSDDPEVVADRINNAMQGSGPEAHKIAEELAQAPSAGKGSSS